MTTKVQDRQEGRGVDGRAFRWSFYMVLAAGLVGSVGCQSVQVRPRPAGEVSESAPADCLPGDCRPGPLNGMGIYVTNKGNYSFVDVDGERFFPEAFINQLGENGRENGVMLEFRDQLFPDQLSPSALTRQAVSATKHGGDASQDVKLLSMTGEHTRLSIKYSLGGKEYTATGDELTNFTFRVAPLRRRGGDVNPFVNYEFTVTLKGRKAGIDQYQIQYRDLSLPNSPLLSHCQQDESRKHNEFVSFLPGERVSSVNAYAQRDPHALTMACESGAIVKCMSWGALPWDASGQIEQNHETVWRSCLQGKRAAYFVGHGDLRSYTVTGTQINVRDEYGVLTVNTTNGDGTVVPNIPRLEAIWSPKGAVCLNRENLRRKKGDTGFKDNPSVPPCGQELKWLPDGTFATGPVQLPH